MNKIEALFNKINKNFECEYLDGHLMINGDCSKVMQYMREGSINLAIPDAPYFGIVKNKWDNQWATIQEFAEWTGRIGKQIYRVLKDNGSFYWFGDDENIAYCQVELDKQWRLLNSLVWRKNNAGTIKGTLSFRKYSPITERILFYGKGESRTGLEMVKEIMPNPFGDYLRSELPKAFGSVAKFRKYVISNLKLDSAMVNRWFDCNCLISKERYLKIREYLKNEYLTKEYEELRQEYEELRRPWNNDKKAFDVLDFPICQDQGRFHATQKPIKLITYLIERSSRVGDIVFDPFSGSGTTAICCHRTGRLSISVEKCPEMFKKSVHRVKEEQRQLKLAI